MSSGVISFFLKVFMPTAKAIYHPVILPSFSSDLRHPMSLLHVLISPESRAHSNDPKNAYSPRFSVGWLEISISYFSLMTDIFWLWMLMVCSLLMVVYRVLILAYSSFIFSLSFSCILDFFSDCISIKNFSFSDCFSCSISPSMIMRMMQGLFGNSLRYRVSILLMISTFSLHLALRLWFF